MCQTTSGQSKAAWDADEDPSPSRLKLEALGIWQYSRGGGGEIVPNERKPHRKAASSFNKKNYLNVVFEVTS